MSNTVIKDLLETTLTVEIPDTLIGVYEVIKVYLNGALYSTHAVGGSATINGVTYATSSGMQDLDWISSGDFIQMAFTSYIFGLTALGDPLTTLPDGVYKFHLMPGDESVEEGAVDIYLGRTVYKELMCCVVDKTSALLCASVNCPPEEVLEKINKIYLGAKMSDIAAIQGEFSNAECMYNVAAHLCDAGCGCGCS